MAVIESQGRISRLQQASNVGVTEWRRIGR